MRRPRLTRKRIEGLAVMNELVDQLLITTLTRSERAKVKTAQQLIGDMHARQQGQVTTETHKH